MNARRRTLGCALALFLAALDVSGHAQGRLVLLGADESRDPLVTRLYEELVAMGLRVESAPPGTSEGDLHALGRSRGAEAVIRVRTDAPDITIWVGEDGEPHRVTSGASSDRATVALAAAEVLRGYLVPVPADAVDTAAPAGDAAAEEPREDEPPAPAPAPEPAEETRTAALYAGPSWLLSPGGVPDQLALQLGFELRVLGSAHLELLASLGAPGVTLTGKRDEVPVWTAMIGAGIGYALIGPDAPFFLTAAAGVAGVTVLYEKPNGSTNVAAAAVPYVHFAARQRIDGMLGVRADATAGYAIPALELEIAGDDPKFGRPIVTLGLSLELAW